ncbi:MAG: hypothetical protein HYY06_23975 [Deltaproteobacteria bacterium]|nr:hypothetical protein [Deltaproteobacteria bacterium]
MRPSLPFLVALAAACGDDDQPADETDAAVDAGADSGPVDSGPEAAAPAECEGFVVPERPGRSDCPEPDVDRPDQLAGCVLGSGHAGSWVIDGDGLPAYDFAVDERCDPAGQHWSPRPDPQRDPVHLIGNGRGLVAMARASGAVELYTQDRGHTWVNFVDRWSDPRAPEFPPQVGGGWSYLADEAGVESTRFEDLPVGQATDMESRRFGVGYVETDTALSRARVVRRVFAPDSEARALVAEVTVTNPGAEVLRTGLVELWDPNLRELVVEIITSDVLFDGITDDIERRRRDLLRSFGSVASWDPERRIAEARTEAASLPDGVDDRFDPSDVDYFPDPVWLAPLDEDGEPDAVWLAHSELWEGSDRTPPALAAAPGDATARSLELDGWGQPALLAMRVPIEVPPGGQVTRRFAFGTVPGGGDADAAVEELRSKAATLRERTQARWRERLVWAALQGLEDAGAVQREIAWASYNLLANATFDEYRGTLLEGQGGSYKYIHGVDGAMGDLCLFADALGLVDPALAGDTLAYTMATLHGSEDATPWRYPYATTGVGSFNDAVVYDQRSDAYWLVPSSVARYVAITRDEAFLDRVLPYWPRAAGETGDVLDHVRRGLDYATEELGIGARGLVAMGTGDYADGITNLTDEEATPEGSSSTYNAGFVVLGLPLAADVVEARDPELADRMRALVISQTEALETEAWQGEYYLRGFVDSGNPLAPEIFFLEPQVLPIAAGLVDGARRDSLLDLVRDRLETPYGAMSNTPIGDPGGGGDIDEPQLSGIWPVANAWLTEAYAMADPADGWDSFVRNTLFTHAETFPGLWYGVWTGPDSYNGPDHDRAGEADAHPATALTDYPAFNAHIHTSPLRALQAIAGVRGTRDGIEISPLLPTETFTIAWPRLRLEWRPDSVRGALVASATAPVEMRIALPSSLAKGAVAVTVGGTMVAHAIDDGSVVFTLEGRDDEAVEWQVLAE